MEDGMAFLHYVKREIAKCRNGRDNGFDITFFLLPQCLRGKNADE